MDTGQKGEFHLSQAQLVTQFLDRVHDHLVSQRCYLPTALTTSSSASPTPWISIKVPSPPGRFLYPPRHLVTDRRPKMLDLRQHFLKPHVDDARPLQPVSDLQPACPALGASVCVHVVTSEYVPNMYRPHRA